MLVFFTSSSFRSELACEATLRKGNVREMWLCPNLMFLSTVQPARSQPARPWTKTSIFETVTFPLQFPCVKWLHMLLWSEIIKKNTENQQFEKRNYWSSFLAFLIWFLSSFIETKLSANLISWNIVFKILSVLFWTIFVFLTQYFSNSFIKVLINLYLPWVIDITIYKL